MSRPTRDNAAGRAYLDLQNRARREGRGTQELLTMYVVERWLARLSVSPWAGDFILKGGILLAAFGNRRPTQDADALALNIPADRDAVAARITEIAALPSPDADDGVRFLTDTTKTSIIRDDALYSGVRAAMAARIATAEVRLRLDINFGDPVTPGPRPIELPALRPDTETVRLLGYPIETVLAEKIVTGISLGAASTRVRDWADIYTLTGTHPVGYGLVRQAVIATATFRGAVLVPLSQAIGALVELRSQTYTAYRRGLGPDGEHLPERFVEVVSAVIAFVDPLVDSGHEPTAEWDPSARRWAP